MTATQEWERTGSTDRLDELDFTAFDHVANAAYVVAPDYRIRWLNAMALERLRFMKDDPLLSRSDVIGTWLGELYLDETHGERIAYDGSLLPYEGAYEFRGRWREARFAAITDPRDGRYLGATLQVLDITEHKATEVAALERQTDAHALSQLLERLSQVTSVSEMVGATMDSVVASYRIAYASAYKIDTDDLSSYLVGRAGQGGGYADTAGDLRLRRGEGLSGRAWEAGGLYVVDDLASVSGDARLGDAVREGFVSGFGLAVGDGERLTGSFEFLSRTPLTFTEERREALASLARVCSDTTVRMYRESAERAQAQRTQERVGALLEVAKAAEAGDLTREVPVDDDDVVGQMAVALGGLMAAMRESLVEIDSTASTLASASDLITALTTELVGGAAFAADKAASASGATVEVSASIQSVATAAEEMSASINEIARNATEATGVASEAVAVAGGARDTITELVEASSAIGQVVKLITSIATQTNLLALNATIEAARAGDAGRGFAVVAHEVKELAGQTARATEDIGSRIATIQERTTEATGAIGRVTEIIGRINDIQTTIASAVEQQTATTNEIARSVTEVAAGSNAIAEDVNQVAGGTELGRKGTLQTADAAHELEAVAARMRELVGRFAL